MSSDQPTPPEAPRASGGPKQFSLRVLFRQASVLFSGQFIAQALSFASSIVLVRGMGPAAYGVWGVAIGLANSVRVLLGFQVADPLTRHLVQDREHRSKSYLGALIGASLWADLGCNLVACLVVWLIAPWSAERLAGNSAETVLVNRLAVVSACLCWSLHATWYTIARDQRRFREMFCFSVLLPALQLIPAVILWRLKRLDLLALSWVYVFSGACMALGKGYSIYRALTRGYGLTLADLSLRNVIRHHHELGRFWEFMLVRYLESVVTGLMTQGDVLVLGYFAPDAEVGFYRLAKQAMLVLGGLGGHAGQVLYQDLNEMIAAGDYRSVRRGIRKLFQTWTPLFTGVCVLTMAVSGPLLRGAYGERCDAAVPIFRMLLVYLLAGYGVFWTAPLVRAMGSYREMLGPTMLLNSIRVIAMAYGAKVAGGVGMAVAFSLTQIALTGVYLARNSHDLRRAETLGAAPPEAQAREVAPSVEERLGPPGA